MPTAPLILRDGSSSSSSSSSIVVALVSSSSGGSSQEKMNCNINDDAPIISTSTQSEKKVHEHGLEKQSFANALLQNTKTRKVYVNAKKICSFEGCTTIVGKEGGVCFTHGANRVIQRYSFEGVPNTLLASPKINLFRISREEEGLKMDAALWGVPNSVTHGATKERKRCSFKGCTKKARGKVGVCVTHGAKLKRCSQMY